MRKALACFLIAAVFLTAFSGCGAAGENPQAAYAEVSVPELKADPDGYLGQDIELKDLRIDDWGVRPSGTPKYSKELSDVEHIKLIQGGILFILCSDAGGNRVTLEVVDYSEKSWPGGANPADALYENRLSEITSVKGRISEERTGSANLVIRAEALSWPGSEEAAEPAGAEAEESPAEGFSAEWQEFYIPERQISVALPAAYEAITLQTESSSLLEPEEIAAVQETMRQSGHCIDAVLPDFSREITVNAADNIWPSLGLMTEDAVSSFAATLEEEYRKNNAVLQESEVVRDGNFRYMRVRARFGSGAEAYDALQYGTILDNQAVWIGLFVYDGEITQADEDMMAQIWARADLLKHEEAAGEAAGKAEAPEIYTDPDTGFRFEIPDGWEQLPLSKERQFLKMKMSPIGGAASASIMYTVMDVYTAVGDEQRKLWRIESRRDVDALLDADFAEMMIGAVFSEDAEFGAGKLNIQLTSVSGQEINGMRYYTAKARSTYDVTESFSLMDTETTVAVFLENGYIVMFQFLDLSNQHKYQDAFDRVLSSFTP